MELKTRYQYTYFIYPFAIKEENYKKYVLNLLKDKKYRIKFFDSFKDIELFKYFVPSVKQNIFQDFSFTSEKINKFQKFSNNNKFKILENQNCLAFEYILEDEIQGKVEEKEGIFFTISKVELVCFKTGICFFILKTHLIDTNSFQDLLNFNHKFENINFENKNINKLDNIKIQTNKFENISNITKILEKVSGKKLESNKLDIDENLFLVYTYACIESNFWNKDNDFENIENEFVKLAEVKPSTMQINVDYDKLSIISNSSYMKIRMNSKCSALICSSIDSNNYTKLAQDYENQYLYTYIIALHQRYYLKKLNKEFNRKTKKAIEDFIKFNNQIWISDLTEDALGQKLYKRCREKLNLEEIYNEAKNKYDIFYKKLNIEKNKKMNVTLIITLIICLILGLSNYISLLFFK